MYVSIKFRSLHKKTKFPYPEYNVNNLKYWRDRYSDNRWDGYDIKIDNLFKYSKDEIIKKVEENVNKKDEKIVRMKIELIIQYKDHYDSIMLYNYSAWDFGRKCPAKWVNTKEELDQLISTSKSV